jgi:hypothetical protein
LLKGVFEARHHGIKNRHDALGFAIMEPPDPLDKTARSNPFGRLGQRKHWTQSERGQRLGATAKHQQRQRDGRQKSPVELRKVGVKLCQVGRQDQGCLWVTHHANSPRTRPGVHR